MNSNTINFKSLNIPSDVKLTPINRLFRMLSLDKREIFIVYIYAIFNGLIRAKSGRLDIVVALIIVGIDAGQISGDIAIQINWFGIGRTA